MDDPISERLYFYRKRYCRNVFGRLDQVRRLPESDFGVFYDIIALSSATVSSKSKEKLKIGTVYFYYSVVML